jgi:hypothetical protein
MPWDSEDTKEETSSDISDLITNWGVVPTKEWESDKPIKQVTIPQSKLHQGTNIWQENFKQGKC